MYGVLCGFGGPTSSVCVMHRVSNADQAFSVTGLPSCLSQPSQSATTGGAVSSVIRHSSWTCDYLPAAGSNVIRQLSKGCYCVNCPFNGTMINVTCKKNSKKKAKQKLILFLWFICWFITRCEYDSMFVQDDVILNVDFLFLKKKPQKTWYSYWTVACTTSPLQATVFGCLDSKVNKEIMFRPFCC